MLKSMAYLLVEYISSRLPNILMYVIAFRSDVKSLLTVSCHSSHSKCVFVSVYSVEIWEGKHLPESPMGKITFVHEGIEPLQ